MSNFFFDKRHADLLKMLLNAPDGFVVYYDQKDRAQIIGQHWCFVPTKDAQESVVISDEVCDELVRHGILIPELNDVEYSAQCAVGTQKGRIYKVSKAFIEVF